MEDILRFLLIAGVIAISFIRQAKKTSERKAGGTSAMPDAAPVLPESRNGRDYGEYVPAPPKPKVATPRKKTAKKQKNTTTHPQPLVRPNKDYTPAEPEEASSGFEIRSAEEARKAIIWGEILRRKY